MQVNDTVKVIAAGSTYEGQAGIVIRNEGGTNIVQLDLHGAPIGFVDAELQFLGR